VPSALRSDTPTGKWENDGKMQRHFGQLNVRVLQSVAVDAQGQGEALDRFPTGKLRFVEPISFTYPKHLFPEFNKTSGVSVSSS
jgi:hypothetical protein